VFLFCGQRSINLGGSTGLEFFRPIDAPFEAADLQVYANVFVGSTAPIAYVGSVRVDVTNNTIWLPENWVIRILQETVDPNRFASCGDNIFRNNLVVVNNQRSRDVNVGSNTRPESFLFTNNLWYNLDDPNWSGPDLPVNESNSLVSQDPLLGNPDQLDFTIPINSPAVASGDDVSAPEYDLFGNLYNSPRSIGAVEGNSPSLSIPIQQQKQVGVQVRIYPNPTSEACQLQIILPTASKVRVRIVDIGGRELEVLYEGEVEAGRFNLPVVLPQENGIYAVQVEVGKEVLTTPIIRMQGRYE
ncbi:MAG: T9SS type A sorting domain-containing protein, partial [Candidatus Kapaibacterium sp.]